MSSRNKVLQATVNSLALSKTQLSTKLATLRADLASLAADNHNLQGANMELKAHLQAAMQQAQQQGFTVPPLS
jgi:regulator of replication initiation timing